MKKNYVLAITAILTIALTAKTLISRLNNNPPLKSYFQVAPLLKDPGIIEPTNTATIGQFYLLENLAASLVKDSMAEATGYEGMLAESWKQLNPSTWQFKIHPNLKWSDGSPLTTQQIADFLANRLQHPSRHTVCLRYLNKVTVSATNEITLYFNRPIGDTLLHELSLADHSVWHPESRKNLWHITSGPYVLKSIDKTNNSIILTQNPNFIQPKEHAPTEVLLMGPIDQDVAAVAFSKHNYDLLTFNARLDHPKVVAIRKDAPARFTGVPNGIRFAAATYSKSISATQRKQIAASIQTLLRDSFSSIFTSMPSVTYDDQIAPPGYSGRVEKRTYLLPTTPISLKQIHLVLVVSDSHSEIKEKLISAFESLKPQFAEIRIEADTPENRIIKNDGPPQAILYFQMFHGNQRDSLGSWAFLSSKGGVLEPYHKEIAPFLEKAIGQNFEERTKTLTELHKKALDEGWLIPFAVEGSEAYHSDRISLNRWNRFDMRFRFYDVEML